MLSNFYNFQKLHYLFFLSDLKIKPIKRIEWYRAKPLDTDEIIPDLNAVTPANLVTGKRYLNFSKKKL